MVGLLSSISDFFTGKKTKSPSRVPKRKPTGVIKSPKPKARPKGRTSPKPVSAPRQDSNRMPPAPASGATVAKTKVATKRSAPKSSPKPTKKPSAGKKSTPSKRPVSDKGRAKKSNAKLKSEALARRRKKLEAAAGRDR